MSHAYGLQAPHPTIITAPGVTASPYPTLVPDAWVWVVYFLEDRAVHVTATDVRRYSHVAALDVLDAAAGSFLVGHSGAFDVPPSDAK